MSTLPDIDLSEYEEVIEEETAPTPSVPKPAPEDSDESEGEEEEPTPEKEKGNRESSIIGVTR